MPSPHDMLEVPADVKLTRKTLTRAFRQKARRLHPDKGGSPEEFQYLKECYAELMSAIDDDLDDSAGSDEDDWQLPGGSRSLQTVSVHDARAPITRKSNTRAFDPSSLFNNRSNPNVPMGSGERFDKSRFNQEFERQKKDRKKTAWDTGYGDMMQSSEFATRGDPEDTRAMSNTQLVEFNDDRQYGLTIVPQALSTLESSPYEELGVNKVDDFTLDNMTDYKRAYHTNSRFDPGSVQIEGRAKTVQQLEAQRSIVAPLSAAEQADLDRVKAEEEREMRRRRKVYKRELRDTETAFDRMHIRAIDGGGR